MQESCGRPIAITCVGQALTLETSGLVNPHPREDICLKVFVHINELQDGENEPVKGRNCKPQEGVTGPVGLISPVVRIFS